MDAKSLYSEDYLKIFKVASEGLAELSSFWKEIGIQGEEESNRLEKEFLNNCCSALSSYIEGVLEKLKMVFSLLFYNVQEKEEYIQSIDTKKQEIAVICEKIGYDYESVSDSFDFYLFNYLQLWRKENGESILMNKSLQEMDKIISHIKDKLKEVITTTLIIDLVEI